MWKRDVQATPDWEAFFECLNLGTDQKVRIMVHLDGLLERVLSFSVTTTRALIEQRYPSVADKVLHNKASKSVSVPLYPQSSKHLAPSASFAKNKTALQLLQSAHPALLHPQKRLETSSTRGFPWASQTSTPVQKSTRGSSQFTSLPRHHNHKHIKWLLPHSLALASSQKSCKMHIWNFAATTGEGASLFANPQQ